MVVRSSRQSPSLAGRRQARHRSRVSTGAIVRCGTLVPTGRGAAGTEPHHCASSRPCRPPAATRGLTRRDWHRRGAGPTVARASGHLRMPVRPHAYVVGYSAHTKNRHGHANWALSRRLRAIAAATAVAPPASTPVSGWAKVYASEVRCRSTTERCARRCRPKQCCARRMGTEHPSLARILFYPASLEISQ